MRNNNTVLVIILLIISFSIFLFSFKEKNLVDSDCTPVGTVIYSIIKPEIFLENYKNWRLLEGQEIENSWVLRKFTFGLDSLPNTNGLFFRSSNLHGRGFDSDTFRTPLSIQEDATRVPKTPFIHTHHVAVVGPGTGDLIEDWNSKTDEQRDELANKSLHVGVDIHSILFRGPYKTYKSVSDPILPGLNYNQGGDLETRPKNISFYTYIKIN